MTTTNNAGRRKKTRFMPANLVGLTIRTTKRAKGSQSHNINISILPKGEAMFAVKALISDYTKYNYFLDSHQLTA